MNEREELSPEIGAIRCILRCRIDARSRQKHFRFYESTRGVDAERDRLLLATYVAFQSYDSGHHPRKWKTECRDR